MLVFLFLLCSSYLPVGVLSSSDGEPIPYDCQCLHRRNASMGRYATTACQGSIKDMMKHSLRDCIEKLPHGSGHEVAAETEVFLLVLCMIVGLVFRQFKGFPYTVLLLAGGAAFQCMFGYIITPIGGQEDPQFLLIIRNLDPHVILYVFLPALIFESAYYTNPHVFIKQLGNVLLLAFPGVMIASFLTALFAQHVMYGSGCSPDINMGDGCHGDPWDFQTSMLFGAIMSATDPVAVVGLLKELGAPEQLSVLIEGESLLNDGTAVVIFTIFSQNMFALLDPAIAPNIDPHTHAAIEYDVPGGIGKFLAMSLVGPMIGIIIAYCALQFLHCLHNDTLSEVSVTLVVAYLPFLLAELAKVSGVLAVVGAGVVMGLYRTEVSASVTEFLHETWELLSYLLNTTLFVVTGVFVAHRAQVSHGITFTYDFPMALLLYVAITLIRGLVLLAFYPIMRRCGYEEKNGGVTLPSLLICWWGGLRGAVGLALAMIIQGMTEKSSNYQLRLIGDRILFHTSIIAAMTLVINGSTTAYLLKYLRLNRVSKASIKTKLRATVRLDHVIKNRAKQLHRAEFSTFFKQLTEQEWTKVWYHLPVHSEAVYVLRTESKHRVFDGNDESLIPVNFRGRWRRYKKHWGSEEVKDRVNKILRSNATADIQGVVHRMRTRSISRSTTVDFGLDMEEARRRFVAAAKGMYNEQFTDGFISMSAAYSHLIEAEDLTIDHPDRPMDHFNATLSSAVELPGCAKCLLKFMKRGPLKCISNFLLQRHALMVFEILSNFIYVHERVMRHLQSSQNHEGVLGNNEALRLSFENRKLLEEAHVALKDLHTLFPDLLREAGTKMAARVMLETERATTMEEYEDGELMSNEMKAMIHDTVSSIAKSTIEGDSFAACTSVGTRLDALTLVQKNNRARPYQTLALFPDPILQEIVRVGSERFYEHGEIIYNAQDGKLGLHYIGRGHAIVCCVLNGPHENDNRARKIFENLQRGHNAAVTAARKLRRKETSGGRKLFSAVETNLGQAMQKASPSPSNRLSRPVIGFGLDSERALEKAMHGGKISTVSAINLMPLKETEKSPRSDEGLQSNADKLKHTSSEHVMSIPLRKRSSKRELLELASECGADMDNNGLISEHELDMFINIQQMFSSGTVSIIRSLRFGDIAGSTEVLQNFNSYSSTMEAESSLRTLFLPKQHILKLMEKYKNLRSMLWKEAAVEIIQTSGVFPDDEYKRSQIWNNIDVACRHSHVMLVKASSSILKLKEGHGMFILSGSVKFESEEYGTYHYASASDVARHYTCSGDDAVLMVFPPTSLNAMHLKCPLGLIAGEGSIIKTVLKSLTYSSKEERLFALNATLDKLSLREINRVIEEDLDFIRSEEEQEFLDLLLKKKQQMIDGTSLDGETIKAAKNSLKEDAQKLKHYTSV
jgi:NhaP-type Na+/H+ or K+/H+ antiporter